jgi:hypothetical protein
MPVWQDSAAVAVAAGSAAAAASSAMPVLASSTAMPVWQDSIVEPVAASSAAAATTEEQLPTPVAAAGGSLSTEIVRSLAEMGFEQENIECAVQSLRHRCSSEIGVNEILEELMRAHSNPDILRQASGYDLAHSSSAASSAMPPDAVVHASSAEDVTGEEEDVQALITLARSLSGPSQRVAEEAQVVAGVSFKSVVRLLLRAQDYDVKCIITADERERLKHMIQAGQCQPARRLLDEALSRHREQPRPSCPICFDEIVDEQVFRLGCGHVYCTECMTGHVGAVAFPTCPDTNCDYQLGDDEVGRAGGQERQQAFRDMQLQRAVDQLANRVECPNPECRNVVLCEPGERQRVQCQCGWPPYCSQCRQLYHGRGECSEVGVLREHWANWVTDGRRNYHGQLEVAARTLEQSRSIEDSLRRQRELEADEQYKAEHCKSCPQCGRIVQKLDGCDHMKCGVNYHGGDQQDGCGAEFSWNSAPRYRARVERREVPQVDMDKVKVEGKDARHFFVYCDACGARHIRGPRFRCVHCPEFNVCAECDRNAAVDHPNEHVFEILFVPEELYNLGLPSGTSVQLIGLVQNMTLNNQRARVKRFLHSQQAYELELEQEFEVPPIAPGTVLAADENWLTAAMQAPEPRGRARAPGAGLARGARGPPAGAPPQPAADAPQGRRLNKLEAVPAQFVQLLADTDEEVLQATQAAETQRLARENIWTCLPQGMRVQISGLAVPVNTEQSSGAAHIGSSEPRMFVDELGTVVGSYREFSKSFAVEVDGYPGSWSISEGVYPAVHHPLELSDLEQLNQAQIAARELHLDLPQGQKVEVIASEFDLAGVGHTVAPYDPLTHQYSIRLEVWGSTKPLDGWDILAQHCGIADLFGKTAGELTDLWDNHGLSRVGLSTQNDFVEQAMQKLPEARDEPLVVLADKVFPIISDSLELPILQERHTLASGPPSRNFAGSVAMPVSSAVAMPASAIAATMSGSEPAAAAAEPEAAESMRCTRCGEMINGAVMRNATGTYHFGCLYASQE